MDTTTILITALVTLALCAILYYSINVNKDNMTNGNENKYINVSTINDEPLRKIIQNLSNRIDNMEREDKNIVDKISALQQSDGVSREQTKYLTATVNKANFGS
jgi:hypothetical protein